MPDRPPIYLYTDGAASGNPGPGGYGVVMRCGGYEKEFSGGYILTTNNRMELMAVIVGLEQIKWDRATVYVTSDSKYVVDAINKGWLQGWVIRGFKKKANKDLWLRLLPLLKKHDVSFYWIKGHNEHPENERCDRLAVNVYLGVLERGETLPHDEAYEAEMAKDEKLL